MPRASAAVRPSRRAAIVPVPLAMVAAFAALSASLLFADAAPATPRSLAPAPIVPHGNGLIAFTSDRTGNDDIWTMALDGDAGTLVALTAGPASDSQPAWSPDGTMLAFTSDRTGDREVFTMQADGSLQRNASVDPGFSDSDPSWGPTAKGRSGPLAFTSDRSGNDDIWLRSNAHGQVDLTDDPAGDTQPAYSPDGTRIAFVSDRSGNLDVWVMNARGGSLRDLTANDPAADTQPAWSSDGTRIAFTSARDGNDEIYVMGADGSGQTNITNAPAADTDPTFSPDGSLRVDFTSDRNGNREVYATNVPGTVTINLQTDLTTNAASDADPSWQPLAPFAASGSPVQHVVILYMENHAFDDVLGKICVEEADRCDGATAGQIHDGTQIPLQPGVDIVPNVSHGYRAAIQGINGGAMNGFDLIDGCEAARGYPCYQQYDRSQIPNTAALADAYALSDRTFATDPVGSWGSHLDLAASYLDGFYRNDHHAVQSGGSGWGCDSFEIGLWQPTPTADYASYPTCVPRQDGFGPFAPSAVPWTPTIFDRLTGAGKSWRIYGPAYGSPTYGWSICPTFADCLYTSQVQNLVDPDTFVTDAANGTLPNLSIVIPGNGQSQHNGVSMAVGDNFIGSEVQAVMDGPAWSSTAIFLTWDDCGCFYDHVPPPTAPGVPAGMGIREPFLIIGPYAKPGFVDHDVAGFTSMLTYVEKTFGLAPLSIRDAAAYDYAQSFDYTQPPLAPIPMTRTTIPAWEHRWLAAHPPDPDDPT